MQFFAVILGTFVRHTVQSPDFVYISSKYLQWRYVIINSNEMLESSPSRLIRLINGAPFCCRSWLAIWLSFFSDRIRIKEASGGFISDPALGCSELSKGSHWPILLCHFRPAQIFLQLSRKSLCLYTFFCDFFSQRVFRHHSVVHFSRPWSAWQWIIRAKAKQYFVPICLYKPSSNVSALK